MEKDKVFVVLENVPFEGGAVRGVFSTRKRAERYCELNPIDRDCGESAYWRIEEHTVDARCEEEEGEVMTSKKICPFMLGRECAEDACVVWVPASTITTPIPLPDKSEVGISISTREGFCGLREAPDYKYRGMTAEKPEGG